MPQTLLPLQHRSPDFVEGFVKECSDAGLSPDEIEALYAKLEEKRAWAGAALRGAGKVMQYGLPTLGAGVLGKKTYDYFNPRQYLGDQVGAWRGGVDQRGQYISVMRDLQTKRKSLNEQLRAAKLRQAEGLPGAEQQVQSLEQGLAALTGRAANYNQRMAGLQDSLNKQHGDLVKSVPGKEREIFQKSDDFHRLQAARAGGGLGGWWAGVQQRARNWWDPSFSAEGIASQQRQIGDLSDTIAGYGLPKKVEEAKEWKLQ